ncbi:Microtubule-associated protein futsch [Lasiodiplodia theobromae]|uniref:Microtubule-associated protein futsch n=1 Tax=Lasiodiplodia theobromae TaxID=45133 RepID=UPI0015C3A2B1|nr:Microtubule-associated protein futsch [Lasiodiplodia theobromae]KAF4544926.1 Microtubule-associated protein futsch [Lasiodiplodia theobromae]
MPQFLNFGQSSLANLASTPSLKAPTGFNFNHYMPQIPVNGASFNMPRAVRPNRRGSANTSQKQSHATSVDPQLIAATSRAIGDVTVKMNNLGNAIISLNASMINTVDYLNKLSAAAGGTPAPALNLAPVPNLAPAPAPGGSHRTASAGPRPLAPAPPRPHAPTVSGPVAPTAPMARAPSTTTTLPQKPNPKKRPHPDSAANSSVGPIAAVGTFTSFSASSEHPNKALKRSVQAFAGSSPMWLPEEKQWLRDQARRYKGVVPRPSNKQLAKEFNDHWVGRSVSIKYTTQDGETREFASLPREARSERAVETAARRYRLWDDIMVSNVSHRKKEQKKRAVEGAEKEAGGAEESAAGDVVEGGKKAKDKAGGGKKDTM